MGKENKTEASSSCSLGCLPIIIWIILCIGEPDLLDAIIAWIGRH